MLESRPLAALAEDAGFTSASAVATVSGVSRATVSRLWTDPDWRTTAYGRTLDALDAVVGGILAPRDRTDDLAAELAGHGLTLDREAVAAAAVRSIAPNHIHIALSAAARLMERDPGPAAKTLAQFWGHSQSAALALVFDTAFVDRAPLIDAATDVAGRLTQPGFLTAIGRATLGYHLSRATGTTLTFEPPKAAGQRAFIDRSATMGAIKKGDLDSVARYHQLVQIDGTARLVELYAYPSYARDVGTAGQSFYLPRGVVLAHTAAMSIREIGTEPEAYLSYLTGTFLPLILQRDLSFAGRRPDLAAALDRRRPTIDDPTVAADLDTLTRTLRRTS